MPHNIKMSDTAANAEADALAALGNAGFLRLYDGTQPINANTEVTDQTLLAELRFSDPAWGSASAGVIAANAIAPDDDAKASGMASWYRILMADGITALWDGTVGISGCDININSTAIQQHAVVSISALLHRVTE